MNSRLATGFLLISLLAALPVTAQQAANGSDDPALQRRCTTVELVTDTPLLPYRLIAPYLQRRPDFQPSNLVLTDSPGSADALVQLDKGESGYTKIEVTNRLTGQHRSFTSNWTDYPGMVASDVMDQLKVVCAERVVTRPQLSSASECSASGLARPNWNLAACSHTSWMDNREIYEALKSRDELTQRSVQLLSACRAAGVVLDITHNLDRTAEWNWKLQTAQGHSISAGTVIASSSRDAAAKIAAEAVRDVPYGAADQASATTGECLVQAQGDESSSTSADGSHAQGFKHLVGKAVSYTGQEILTVAADGNPNVTAKDNHGHGFKHVMGRIGFYTGQTILAAVTVAGYAAAGIAMSGY